MFSLNPREVNYFSREGHLWWYFLFVFLNTWGPAQLLGYGTDICSDDENPKDHLMLSKAVFFISTKVGEIDWFEMYFMVSMCMYISYTDLYRYTFLRLMKINLHAILSEAFTPRGQRSRTWLLPEIERLVLTRRVHSLPPSLLCQTLHLPPSFHPTSHLLYISLTPLLPHGLIHSWYLNNSDPELKMSCTPVSLLAVLSLLFVLSCEFDAEDSTLTRPANY